MSEFRALSMAITSSGPMECERNALSYWETGNDADRFWSGLGEVGSSTYTIVSPRLDIRFLIRLTRGSCMARFGGGLRLALGFDSGEVVLFLRPNSLPSAPRRDDFFRCGCSLLFPDCSVPALTLIVE